jgi:hypothetical protein
MAEIHEVDWLDTDYVYEDGTIGRPRHCDVCEASYSDYVDGRVRKFYRDDAERMIVCEICLPKYLSEQGATHARKT